MTIFIISALLALPQVAMAQAPEDDRREIISLKVAGNLLLIADWKQTRFIARHPDEFYEKNPILGRHPSTKRVDLYFIGAIAAFNVADYLLGPRLSNGMWIGVIAVEGVTVHRNAGLGIKIKF